MIKRNFKSFTLLEAVVSVLIFGLLMAAVASLWVACWKASERVAKGGYEENAPELILKRLGESVEASIFHIQPQTLYAWKGVDEGGGGGEADSVSFITALSPDVGESSIQFSPLERVMITAQQGDHGKHELVVLAAPLTMEEDDWQRKTVLLDEIEAFRVRYWDHDRGEWVDGWEEENRAPQAVQMGIVFKGEKTGMDITEWQHYWTAFVHPPIKLENTFSETNHVAPAAVNTNGFLINP